jgi:hypothetical protein
MLKLVEDIPQETFPTHSSNLTRLNYWFINIPSDWLSSVLDNGIKSMGFDKST